MTRHEPRATISIVIEMTKNKNTARLVKVFKALSNDNRLHIFNLVRQGAGRCCAIVGVGARCSCVCDIGDGTKLSLSTVSHHLKELRNAGLIRCEKRGQWVYCAVDPQALEVVGTFLKE